MFLILRTYISVVVARLDGRYVSVIIVYNINRLVKDLVAGDGKAFLKSLGYFMAISIPATYTNSMIKYLQSHLAISLRTALTDRKIN